MSGGSVLELMKDWGYYPMAKPHPDSPGYEGLLVAIRREPTGTHFDPQAMHLRLRDEYGLASWRTLSWLSPFESSGRVCPGMVTLHDWSDKRVYFFTFGGSLEPTPGVDVMVYELRSPAPVLEFSGRDETVPHQLGSEMEELLGEIEITWGADEKGFSRRLAETEPLDFYLSTLRSILQRCEHNYAMEEVYHDLHDALQREKKRLVENGQWRVEPPLLESLLAPG
jgi:hypothetical protein